MNVTLISPFYILVSNVSDREVRRLKTMKIAQTMNALSIIHTIDTKNRELLPIETLEASNISKFNVSDEKII